ncbi:DUF2061 domain-containing protein [Hyphomonadaceae bacterium BL14]|nr:DUF2061 domain-containing protein [Hyphomonadaceae bacterium BL14]
MTALARALFYQSAPARMPAVRRGLLKTLSYGLTHMIVAMAVVFALTRDWRAALAVGLIEPVVQTFAYVLHERAWARAERQPVVHQGKDGSAPFGASHHGPR